MLMGTVTGVGKSFALAMPATIKLASTIGSSMLGASASVTAFVARTSAAASVYAASLAGMAAATASRLGVVAATWAATGIASSAGFLSHIKAMITYYTGALAGVQAITISRAGATAAAWITSSVGADTFANAFSASMKTAAASSKVAASTVGSAATLIAQSTASTAAAVSRLAAPLAAPFVAVGKSVAVFASDIAGGLAFTYKSFVWWATGASARMAQYAASLAGATGKTIASTAAMSAAWLGSAARGVAAFVGSAVAGIGTYLGAAAMAVAGSVASAAAVAAAWLAPLAPLLLLSAAAVGIGVAVKQFGPQIAGAFSGLAGYVTEAGGAIAGGFSTAVSDGIVVLGDLATTATTTFNGVYEAVAAGDLSGAMDVLWAGLVAGWLRGTEALMSYVDPWVAAFQDVFTDIGSGIYIAWDSIYTNSKSILNTMGAYILGFFDNITNGVMNTFDTLVQNIQIAWARAQGFVTGAKDTETRIQAIKDKTALDKEKRKQDNPGIDVRTAKADQENKDAEKDRKDREQAIKDDAQATKDRRQAANQQRADDRRAATQAAEGNLASVMSGQDEGRKDATIAAELLKSLGSASSLDEITNIGASMDALIQRGNVSGEMESKLLDAYYAAFSRVNVASASASSEKAATAGANAAGSESSVSMGQVAGTFSSTNLGGMGFGSSLAERTAKAAEETAKNTRKIDDGGKVAA